MSDIVTDFKMGDRVRIGVRPIYNRGISLGDFEFTEGVIDSELDSDGDYFVTVSAADDLGYYIAAECLTPLVETTEPETRTEYGLSLTLTRAVAPNWGDLIDSPEEDEDAPSVGPFATVEEAERALPVRAEYAGLSTGDYVVVQREVTTELRPVEVAGEWVPSPQPEPEVERPAVGTTVVDRVGDVWLVDEHQDDPYLLLTRRGKAVAANEVRLSVERFRSTWSNGATVVREGAA